MTTPVLRAGALRAAASRAVVAAALVPAVAVAGCAGGASDVPGAADPDDERTELVLAASSSSEPGFEAVLDGFDGSEYGDRWSVTAGYRASTVQSRKILDGMRADLVALSAQPDMQRLIDAGFVGQEWGDDATGGVPYRSAVALVVRDGNPEDIGGWDDLLRPGVEVVTPDPRSSGAAMWNALAPYAAASDGGRDEQAGLDYVQRLVGGHVEARPSSAREAADLFTRGEGDVLISYESEAVRMAAPEGADAPGPEYLLPGGNVRIDGPVAPVTTGSHPDGARALNGYLYSTEAQRLWAENGYRPVDPGVIEEFRDDFPEPERWYSAEDLGGWDALYEGLFGRDGAISGIYEEATR